MNDKNKNILLGILIVGVLAMTISFASLATNLNITGQANVAATKWNIRFENWHKEDISNGITGYTNTATSPDVNQLATSDNTNITKVENVNVILRQPGDTAKYTFEIANRGTIVAKLSNFTLTNTSENNLVDYQVKCFKSNTLDGNEITQNSTLDVNASIYCYLQVSYKDQTNTNTPGSNQIYEQNEVSTSLSASWTWIQDESNSNNGSSNIPQPTQEDTNVTYISPSGEQTNQIDSTWRYYIKNTSSGKKVCGVYTNDTVCFNQDDYDFISDYNSDDYGLVVNGAKSQALKDRFIAAGAKEISMDQQQFRFGLKDEESIILVSCTIDDYGAILCSNGYGQCELSEYNNGCESWE